MREGINGHVAAEHAPLGTEHLHQRHYPRLQLLLVPIHAEDAFHRRDADTGVSASADGVQVGLPSPIAIDAKINRPAHDRDRETNFWILADYVQEIGQLRGEHYQPAAQIRSLQALKTPSTTLGPPSDRPVERSGEADCGCSIRDAGARQSSSKESSRYPGTPASLDRGSQPGQQAQLGLPKLQPVAAPTSPP